MKNFNDNDLELISAYLDGILTPSESARVESRLSADPEFASVLADIRSTRNILRNLPKRKAPRHFTLTRKMVGMNPPLPRAYSFFKFTSAFATALLIFTFAANALPRINFGFGMGGVAPAPAYNPESESGMAIESAATEAPATEIFALQAPATEAPAMEDAPALTADSASEAPSPKIAATESAPPTLPVAENQPEVKSEAVIPLAWQIVLTGVILSSALTMFALRESAKRKWR